MLASPDAVSQKALKVAGMTKEDIDLFELNEAFASVVLRYMRDMEVPHDKITVNGGEIAMGHPLGATGAMILGTVLDEIGSASCRARVCRYVSVSVVAVLVKTTKNR